MIHLEKIRDKSKLDLSPENIELQKIQLSEIKFRQFADQFGLVNLDLKEVIDCHDDNLIALISKKRSDLGLSYSPAESEKAFLLLMARFRGIGNKNIYGNDCAVFTPPSGYPFNTDVADTYYYMYDGALEGSKAFNLAETFLKKSAEYTILGGTKSMFEWIFDVGIAIGFTELANELTNEQDILDPTLTYLANQSYQSPFFVAYIFGE